MDDTKKLDTPFTSITDETELNAINGGGTMKEVIGTIIKIIKG